MCAPRDLSMRFLLSRKSKPTMLTSALPNFGKTPSNLDDRRTPKTAHLRVGQMDELVIALCQTP